MILVKEGRVPGWSWQKRVCEGFAPSDPIPPASVERRRCDGVWEVAAWPDEDVTPVGDVLTALSSAPCAPGHRMSPPGVSIVLSPEGTEGSCSAANRYAGAGSRAR